MYANSGISALESDNSTDIPEWKKILIMKKRAGYSPGSDEHGRRNPDSNVNIVRNGVCDTFGLAGGVNNKICCNRSAKVAEPDFREISPLKTVTIGNINVELRSIKATDLPISLLSERNCDLQGGERAGGEDLRYGPGIVDRLRAKFLNISVKQQPVVRRFSSLENLPGSQGGPYRVNARGVRQNGYKPGFNHVKKAQSMETLSFNGPEQQIFSASRRPSARSTGCVKARILSRTITPIVVFADENDKQKDKSPSPAVSPKLFKSARRWEYGRSVSAPNINEDELPKPDTVKHVKKIFESPPAGGSVSEKSCVVAQRFRKIPSTTTSSTLPCAILGSGTARPSVKKVSEEDAKTTCAKECPKVNNLPSTPDSEEEKYDDFEISEALLSDNDLSANRSCERVAQVEEPTQSDPSEKNQSYDCGGEQFYTAELESPNKVTPEQLPVEQCHKHSNALFQGNRLEESNSAELDDAVASPPQEAGVQSPEKGMVVAAASAASSGESETDSFSTSKKVSSTWQKPPQSTTSIVFDFRGRKDVEPHISLNPAPFGCRPAKVSKSSSKRSGSPPRSPVNGKEEEDDPHRNDDEDWDEMDIGADLPAISGIVFTGENVKIGRGALLEIRNKKLNIQFDDKATSTFEYPSEYTSPSPREENGCWSDSFNSTIAMGSAANSRLGLSNYTPLVLSSNKEFELGVSQTSHREITMSLDENEKKEDDVPVMDVIVPADPSDTAGWSATETADILF